MISPTEILWQLGYNCPFCGYISFLHHHMTTDNNKVVCDYCRQSFEVRIPKVKFVYEGEVEAKPEHANNSDFLYEVYATLKAQEYTKSEIQKILAACMSLEIDNIDDVFYKAIPEAKI